MRKKIILSSIIFLVSTLLITGVSFILHTLDTNAFFEMPKRLYEDENYEKSLEKFKLALEKMPNNKTLQFNIGQTLYRMAKFDESIEFFNKSNDSVEKYLALGNSYLQLAKTSSEPEMQLAYLQNSLEKLKEGIILFPEDTSLKYNYEFVNNILSQAKKEDSDEKDSGEKKSDHTDSEEKDSEEQQAKEEESQEEQSKEEQSSKDESKGSESKESQSSNEESKDEESKEQQSSSKSDDEPSDKEDASQANASEKSDSEASTQSVTSSENIATPDKEKMAELMNILQMLEKQEEHSLKNNQNIKNYSKEEQNDW
jgi:Ca-activated chloride channel family protein